MKLLSPSYLLVVVVAVVQVLLEPAVLAQPSTCGGQTCLYQPDCTSCGIGNYVPDPNDCQLYYTCTGPNADDYITLPAICPGDQVFDPDQQECVSPDAYTCPTCNSGQVCSYNCATSTNDLFSSRYDCNEYYECDNGVAVGPMHCDAANPFFDGEICQPEETRCCRCQPYCVGSGIIIDPLDCRKYWFCTGTTTPVDFGECPEGKVFDTALQDCSATSTCETTCPNVVNPTGCIDPFICSSTGYFAMCPNLCVNEYYYCEDVSDEYQEPEHCFTGTYFHPDNHICVNLDDCPYPKPESLL